MVDIGIGDKVVFMSTNYIVIDPLLQKNLEVAITSFLLRHVTN